jgi:hypothetical protein
MKLAFQRGKVKVQSRLDPEHRKIIAARRRLDLAAMRTE